MSRASLQSEREISVCSAIASIDKCGLRRQLGFFDKRLYSQARQTRSHRGSIIAALTVAESALVDELKKDENLCILAI